MKTWNFNEEKLNEAIGDWVDAQIKTGHPKAVSNAGFVGKAIKDMLENAETLYVVSPERPPSMEQGRDFEVRDGQSREGFLSIDDMKAEWENM